MINRKADLTKSGSSGNTTKGLLWAWW